MIAVGVFLFLRLRLDRIWGPAHLHVNADYTSDENETTYDCHGKWMPNEDIVIRNRYRQWRNGDCCRCISLLAVAIGPDLGDDDDEIP